MKNFNLTESAAVAIRRITPVQGCRAASAALLTLTLTMGISGCSHSKQQTANSTQNASTQTQSAQATVPAVPVGPVSTTSQPETTKKKSVKGPVKKLPSTRTYKDEVSGLSFTYPRRSILEVGDKAEQDGTAAEQLPMDFVQSGGVTMAVVTLPGIAKSGSDFTPARFAISVNKDLTVDQCAQFAGEDSADKSNTDSADKPASSVSGEKLTIGNVEYIELDKQTERGTVKYYHRFVPGLVADDNACYEFAMSVKSAEPKRDDDKTASTENVETQPAAAASPDEHKAAFAGLEKILASVNIKSDKKSEAVVSSAKQPGANSQ